MEKIITELKEFERQNEALRREKEALVKAKEELKSEKDVIYGLFLEAQSKFNTLQAKYQHERTAKLAAIKNLENSRNEMAKAANIEVNKLQDELSTMTSKSEYEKVLQEVNVLRGQCKEQHDIIQGLNASLESRNNAIIQATLAGLSPEEIFNTQKEGTNEELNVATPPSVNNASGALADGFNLPVGKIVESSSSQQEPVVSPAPSSLSKKVKNTSPSTAPSSASKKQKVSNYCCFCNFPITEIPSTEGIEKGNSLQYQLFCDSACCKRCYMKSITKYSTV